ncbi:MAG: Flp family type IVb pilin [Pseudodesulfovibrio sp.]|jgi:pilus assembly protein Flp/PilA|nr:Flp family type IVb pilin [Pseudodesulfovibrio sp.]
MTKLMNLINDDQGATALEYGLIAALIAAAIGASALALGEQVVATFEYIRTQMLSATAGTAG